jgi:glycosyltransferase involved in cell wall biosynthesis
MRIFLSVASLAAHYGGPARSVLGLAKALGQANVEVGLWAADSSQPIGLNSDDSFSRLQLLQGTFASAIAEFGQPDILHDNGLWWAHNRQISRYSQCCKIPRIVSLRGMVEPWAMQHKRWKKILAWHFYQQKHLQMATCFHGTADKEAQHAKELGLLPRCFTIPNGVDLLNSPSVVSTPSLPTASVALKPNDLKTQTALFLGRLHPVKGLEPFIEAWAQVYPKNWQVQLAGPDENGYQARLQTLLERQGLTDQFEFLGSVDNKQKVALLKQANLLIQPSYSENFGMSIAEALASGVPVLTTTGTPWEIIAQAGCGWRVPLNLESLAEAIKQATDCSPSQLQAMGRIGQRQIADNYSWTSVASHFLETYQWMLGSAAVSNESI